MTIILLSVALLASSFSFATQPSSPGSKIYFGVYEVQAGRLKSADGVLPHAGETVTLAVDLQGLSTSIACHPNDYRCASLEPKLFVRYSGSAAFQEISGLPQGEINPRGPDTRFYYPDWEFNAAYAVSLQIPADADRIETYMVFNRYSYNTSDCRLAYDMMECDISGKTLQGLIYISNFGKNFEIPVRSK